MNSSLKVNQNQPNMQNTQANLPTNFNQPTANVQTHPGGGQQVKSKDAMVITRILKDMGVEEYEPAVVYQLLEFTYRYVTTVLDDAQIFSNYAKKKNIDSEDVRIAIQLQVEKMFTSPPPRDLLLEIARNKNSQTLPPIRSHAGPRLPPDRYSLTVCNYALKSSSKMKNQTHIQLPFRGNTSLLSSGRSSLISLQPRTSNTSQFTASSVTSGVGLSSLSNSSLSIDFNKDVMSGVKRKLEDNKD